MTSEVRIHGSCDACLQSKVKCSQRQPACGRCSKHGWSCVYSPFRKIGRPSHKRPSEEPPSMRLEAASTQGTDGEIIVAAPVLPTAEADIEEHEVGPSSVNRQSSFHDSVVQRCAPGIDDSSWNDDDIAMSDDSNTDRTHEPGKQTHMFSHDTLTFSDVTGTLTSAQGPAVDMDFNAMHFSPAVSTSRDAQRSLTASVKQKTRAESSTFIMPFPSPRPPSMESSVSTPSALSLYNPGPGFELAGHESDFLDNSLLAPFQFPVFSPLPTADFSLSPSPIFSNPQESPRHSCSRQCCLRLTMRMHRLPGHGTGGLNTTPAAIAQLGSQLDSERDIVLNCAICMGAPHREHTLMLLAMVIDRFLPLLAPESEHMPEAETKNTLHRMLVQQLRAVCKLEVAAKEQINAACTSTPYSTEVIDSVLKRIEGKLEDFLRN